MATGDFSVIKRITVNYNDDDYNYQHLIAPQGDGRNRYIFASLIMNNQPYTPPTGSTVILEGKNAGGYNIFNLCSTDTDTDTGKKIVKIPLNNGVLSFAGKSEYRLSVYQGSEIIYTFNLHIFITEAPFDVVRLQASDAYEALTNLVAQAGEVVTWYVGSGVPQSNRGKKGDYYLNSDNGDIYCKSNEDLTTHLVTWEKLNDNIKEKIYVRYSQYKDGKDSTGADSYTKEPYYTASSGDIVYQKYMGILITTINNEDPTGIDKKQDFALVVPGTNATNYHWSLITNQIVGNSIEYAVSSSGVFDASGNIPIDITSWSSTIPTVSAGKYLWTKVYVKYENGYSSNSYSVSKSAVSFTTVNTTYGTCNSPSSHASVVSWVNDPATLTIVPGEYLWTKFTFTRDDGTSFDKYIVCRNTVSLKDITADYGASATGVLDSNGNPPSDITWGTTIPTVNPGEYLWTRYTMSLDDSANTSTYGYTVSKQAVSILPNLATNSNPKIEYAASTQGVDPGNIPPNDWITPSASVPIPTAGASGFLWSKMTLSLDDGKQLEPFYAIGRNGTDVTLTQTTSSTVSHGLNQITAKYSDGRADSVFDIYNGTDADFDSTVIYTTSECTAWPDVAVGISGPSTAKVLDFDFKIRGAKWFSTNTAVMDEITGTGDVTDPDGHYTISNSSSMLFGSNCLTGDVYVNSLGQVYVCKSSTKNGATKWEFLISIGSSVSAGMQVADYANNSQPGYWVNQALYAKEANELTNTVVLLGETDSDGIAIINSGLINTGQTYDVSVFATNIKAHPINIEIKAGNNTGDPPYVKVDFVKAFANMPIKVKLRKN